MFSLFVKFNILVNPKKAFIGYPLIILFS